MKVLSGLSAMALLCIGLVSTPRGLFGQSSNASIRGVITDSSGANVPGAELTLTATDTAAVSKATSGSDGLFSLQTCLPATIKLKPLRKASRISFRPVLSFT